MVINTIVGDRCYVENETVKTDLSMMKQEGKIKNGKSSEHFLEEERRHL